MMILIEGRPYGPFRDAQDAQVFADTYFEGDWQALEDYEVEGLAEVLIQALAFIIVGFGIWTAATRIVTIITGVPT